MAENKRKISQRDPHQIQQYIHDEETDSTRVNIVNIEGLKEGIQESLKDLKVDFKIPEQKEKEIQIVEIPKIITEIKVEKYEYPIIQEKLTIKEISIPEIIKEKEFIYIDRPIIETKIETIEKPIIIEKFLDRKEENNKYLMYILIIQTLILLITLFRK